MNHSKKGAPVTGAKPTSGRSGGAGRQGELPGWTSGLRQLYDQVVEEDLPDSFHDLLARLDEAN